VTYLLVLVLSVAVTELFRWTPLSVPLTGRPSLVSRGQREARARRRAAGAGTGASSSASSSTPAASSAPAPRVSSSSSSSPSPEPVEPDDALVGETDDVGRRPGR
jgi:hypothetical protein